MSRRAPLASDCFPYRSLDVGASARIEAVVCSAEREQLAGKLRTVLLMLGSAKCSAVQFKESCLLLAVTHLLQGVGQAQQQHCRVLAVVGAEQVERVAPPGQKRVAARVE